MRLSGRTALLAWLAIVAASAWWTARHVVFTADLTAFLPAASGRLERLLVEQLRSGVASRTMLIAIEGGAPPELARFSRELARALAADRRFDYVINGAAEFTQGAREFAGEARELRGRAAFDRHQHGAGGHARAQLLDEEPLQAAASCGEEGRQVAGEDHVARGPPCARRDDREPGEERRAPIEPHVDSWWMVITDPSPPGSRISMRTMREPEPAMTMLFTTPATSTSLGVSASVQRRLVPSTLTE